MFHGKTATSIEKGQSWQASGEQQSTAHQTLEREDLNRL
jgi:hypothetical protein